MELLDLFGALAFRDDDIIVAKSLFRSIVELARVNFGWRYFAPDCGTTG